MMTAASASTNEPVTLMNSVPQGRPAVHARSLNQVPTASRRQVPAAPPTTSRASLCRASRRSAWKLDASHAFTSRPPVRIVGRHRVAERGAGKPTSALRQMALDELGLLVQVALFQFLNEDGP